MQIIQSIQNKIYELRGVRVMLDRDLAFLYEVETRVLNQAVKRNIDRFPPDFMFQISKSEFDNIKSQENIQSMSSQIVMTYPSKRPNISLPYAFTEQGVAMLSGVIKSKKAVNMNIEIMRTFVQINKIIRQQPNETLQIDEIKQRLSEHDTQLTQIYDVMENMLDEKAAQRKWDDRERIGFNR